MPVSSSALLSVGDRLAAATRVDPVPAQAHLGLIHVDGWERCDYYLACENHLVLAEEPLDPAGLAAGFDSADPDPDPAAGTAGPEPAWGPTWRTRGDFDAAHRAWTLARQADLERAAAHESAAVARRLAAAGITLVGSVPELDLWSGGAPGDMAVAVYDDDNHTWAAECTAACSGDDCEHGCAEHGSDAAAPYRPQSSRPRAALRYDTAAGALWVLAAEQGAAPDPGRLAEVLIGALSAAGSERDAFFDAAAAAEAVRSAQPALDQLSYEDYEARTAELAAHPYPGYRCWPTASQVAASVTSAGFLLLFPGVAGSEHADPLFGRRSPKIWWDPRVALARAEGELTDHPVGRRVEHGTTGGRVVGLGGAVELTFTGGR